MCVCVFFFFGGGGGGVVGECFYTLFFGFIFYLCLKPILCYDGQESIGLPIFDFAKLK
jgi:hypothetical protein